MPYQENIPQPTDIMSTSQNDILVNFQTIHTAWDINHVPFDAVGQGKHNHVSFPEQAAGPATLVNERAIYAKQSALTAVAELFTRKENSGDEIEFTASLDATPGWTILPSGIILKWGVAAANGATAVALPAAGTIPVYTTIFSVQLTIVDNAAADADEAVRVVSFAAPGTINVWGSPRTTAGTKAVNFEYLVIGV